MNTNRPMKTQRWPRRSMLDKMHAFLTGTAHLQVMLRVGVESVALESGAIRYGPRPGRIVLQAAHTP